MVAPVVVLFPKKLTKAHKSAIEAWFLLFFMINLTKYK